jgi:predicted acylesterase/phospholipase RssA
MKRGLVLCGGGSKGSYETGCWRALEELGIKFDIVTGTSIGCLNGAMYCQHQYQEDYDLWDKIQVGMIIDSGFNFENNQLKKELKKQSGIISFVTKYISNLGTDITPFKNILNKYIDVKKIKESDVTFGICCAKFPSMQGIEVVGNTLDEKKIKKYILASASPWPVFPVCKIDKQGYVDGGYYDNLPIDFCLRLGADEIVAIDLNPKAVHPEYIGLPFVTYIKPYHSLGSFMNFNHDTIMDNFIAGYYDTLKIYGKCMGYRYNIIPTRSFKKEAEEFNRTLKLYQASIHINNLKLPKQKNDTNLYEILKEHTYTPLKDYDYFIRAIEIALEDIEMPYNNLYKLEDLLDKLFMRLNMIRFNKNLMDKYNKAKTSIKKQIELDSLEKHKILRYFLDKEVDDKMLLDFLCAKPKTFIEYILIKSFNKR